MHLEAMIKLNSEMHLEAVIERVWRCIWRLTSSNAEMPLEAEIKLNSERHLEAVTEQVSRWIWMPISSGTQSCTSRP